MRAGWGISMAASSDKNAVNIYDDNFAPPATVAHQMLVNRDVDIANIVGILRRRWLFPLLGCLVGLVVGRRCHRRVRADALQEQRAHPHRQERQQVSAGQSRSRTSPVFDDMETGSQVHVLTSESIVVPVVRSMNLANDPEFVRLLSPGDGERGRDCWRPRGGCWDGTPTPRSIPMSFARESLSKRFSSA